jgi:hypothetical protein
LICSSFFWWNSKIPFLEHYRGVVYFLSPVRAKTHFPWRGARFGAEVAGYQRFYRFSSRQVEIGDKEKLAGAQKGAMPGVPKTFFCFRNRLIAGRLNGGNDRKKG